nr:histidine triad nucleotide-binding protein [bacterium]
MADCVFCKILAGEIPSTRVMETEDAIVIRDIQPQAPVHLLVIPRRHVENAAGLANEPELLGRLVALAVRAAQQEGLTGGYRIITNTGDDAGQSVHHLHIHVLGGAQLSLTMA